MTTRLDVETAETGAPWVNASGLESYDLTDTVNRVARELASWVNTTRGASRPSLFNRAAYVAPDNPYVLMATAKNAVDNDDIVGGTCDVTEGLMLQGLKWEADEADDADYFNQMARDLNLDEFARSWHREDFTYAQAVIGMWWGRRQYTARTKSPTGKKSKRTKIIYCPVALTLLDPAKVVPLQPGPFGQDRLAWRATHEEYTMSLAVQDGTAIDPDPLYNTFTTGPVTGLPKNEQSYLQAIGVDPKRLVGLDPEYVFRICRLQGRLRALAQRPAQVRCSRSLDLKQQLMEADRVSLVGSANYLLLVRQGSKEEPARQEEIDNLNENFQVVAKLPVIVGDHRLQIDIITPQQEWTLSPTKYDTIDRRILSRVLGALTVPGGQRGDTTITIGRGIARLLENRRHIFKRALEERIARVVVEHPANAGVFKGEPNLTFTPRNVALDSDAEVSRAVLALRTQNELSRESTLEYYGFDQSVEAMRREYEDESGYDDIFKTQVPFSAPQPGQEPPQVSGARGGRPDGGGDSPQSPQGQTKKRNQQGRPST